MCVSCLDDAILVLQVSSVKIFLSTSDIELLVKSASPSLPQELVSGGEGSGAVARMLTAADRSAPIR